jgi:hypothetical protein
MTGPPSFPRYPAGAPREAGPGGSSSSTNPLAIASLVCGCCGIIPLIGLIGAVLGVIFGAVARGQISRSGGAERGGGLALAGIIVGACFILIGVVILVTGAVHGHLHLRHHLFGHI